MALRAGVVGLGMIGGGVAQCLARAGLLAGVHDVRPDASAELPGVPEVMASPAMLAAQCDVVLIAVVSAEQARDVLTGNEGLLAAGRKGLIIGLLSTVSLDDLADLRTIVEDGGARLIDAGVSGGHVAAERGMISLVGADAEDFATALPVLEAFSAHVAHMGGPGAGMASKIARNVMVYGAWRAGYEGVLLARAAGIDTRKLVEAIEISTPGLGNPAGLLLRPDPAQDVGERRFREGIDTLLRKDLAAALSLAEDVGVALPTTEVARRTSRAIMGLDEGEANA